MASTVGKGTTNSPLRGDKGACPVRGCEKFGDHQRITRSGMVIMYCGEHYRRAVELFAS